MKVSDSWERDALCFDSAYPDAWFPRLKRGELLAAEAAIRVCGTCPVKVVCGAKALAERIEHGVWGGINESERRSRLRKQSRVIGASAARELNDELYREAVREYAERRVSGVA